MDVRAQTSFIAALVSLALAASILLRSNKQRAHWLYGMLGINVALWYVSSFIRNYLGDPPLWERIHLACGVLLPLAAVHFFGVFVAEQNRRMRVLSRAATLCAIVILVAITTPMYDHEIVLGGLFVYVIIFVFAALAVLYAGGRAASSRLEGARLKYMAIVGGLGGLFTVFEYLPLVGVDIPPVGTILILVFLYVLAQSIAGYRLLDLYELAGRLGVLTALAFMLATMLWLLALVSKDRFFIHGVVSALVVLVLFDPVRTKVQAWISQVFFHERFDLEQNVAELRSDVAHALQIDDLSNMLMKGLADSRRVTHAALYLAGPDLRAFFLKSHTGPKPPNRVEMAPARPLLDRMSVKGTVVLENAERELDELRTRGDDLEAETIHEVVETMRVLNASVCIAVQGAGGDLYGFMTVRDARLRDAFSPEEVQLLAGLGVQAAVAVENSRLYQQLKERDRLAALGEMAAGLAHEIRNPLGAIKASAQYLTEPGHESEGGREFLDIIVDEVDRLNRVVGSFLDYAKPAQGDPEPTYINAAIQRTLQLLGPECELAHVTLRQTLDPDLPKIRIDVEHLRQVLINLVRNSLQAIEGSGKIEVTTRVMDRIRVGGGTKRWAEIRVRDNGPGIAAEVMPHLFVPFVTTKQKGSGLGLAISHRIISAAGGRIEVRSPPGSGATFLVILPGHEEKTRPSDAPPPNDSDTTLSSTDDNAPVLADR